MAKAKSSGTVMLQAAFEYVARGFNIVPCIGKRPALSGWQMGGVMSETEVHMYFGRGDRNIGLNWSGSGLIDVECDSEEAKQNLLTLFGGDIPATPEYKSRRGTHRIFRAPEGLPLEAVIHLDGIEFRCGNGGKGAQSLVPPSIHPDTRKCYTWLPGRSLFGDLKPAELPAHIVERLRNYKPERTAATGEGAVAEGERNDVLFGIACRLRDAGHEAEMLQYAVLAANTARCEPPLAEAEVLDIVKSVMSHKSQSDWPLRVPAGRTETANAKRLVERFGDVIRWVGPWDKWLHWDGRRWKIDDMARMQSCGKQIAKGLWKELAAEIAAGKLDKDAITAIYAFAKSSNSANGVRNMVSLGRSEPGIPIGVDELDTDPWLLNVRNGTLDLRTGTIREHRQADNITKLAPVGFDPLATCPIWDAFLRKIFAEKETLITYMQRLVGYSLTGVAQEHILPFLYGIGANGKSTFAELLLKLFGPDYAMKAAPDLLLAKHNDSHPTERADLFGKRFVACIETEDGRRLAESLVKELTGGDRVRARRMREDFWEFAPTHHVWLAGNYKPTIRGTDHGIWRRVKLIPFDVVISDDEQDKHLSSKLAGELSGILNWALAGCLNWQRSGMVEPTEVQMATQEYSHEMDTIGQFIAERCELGEEYREVRHAALLCFPK